MTVFFVNIVVIGIIFNGKGVKMKFLAALFFSAVFFFTGSLYAQNKRAARKPAISEIQLNAAQVNTPSLLVQDKADAGIPLGKVKKWLQFQIAYKFSQATVNAKRVFEDMKVELYVRHPAPEGYAWFTGTQYLHCVMADTERHYVALYMPPSTVTRYISREKKAKDILKNFIGIVIISDRDDNILGIHYFDLSTGSKKLTRNQRNAVLAAYRTINQAKYKFVNGIWPKENTPWEWIDAEKYDLPRPVFSNPGKAQAKPMPAEQNTEEESGE